MNNPDNDVFSDYTDVLVATTGFTVTFSAGANGSVSDTSPQFVKGGEACSAVTAVPVEGYHFTGWSGDYEGTANPLTITDVSENMNITAVFEKDPDPVAESAKSGGGGGGCFIGTLGRE